MFKMYILVFAILVFLSQVLIVFCCVVAGKQLDTEMENYFAHYYSEETNGVE